MTIRVDGTTSAGRPQPPALREATRTDAVGPNAALSGTDRVELSSVPPKEVQDAVDFAFKRAAELNTRGRELHFVRNDDTGKVVVQVRDLEGKVLRTVPNSEIFEIVSDGPVA